MRIIRYQIANHVAKSAKTGHRSHIKDSKERRKRDDKRKKEKLIECLNQYTHKWLLQVSINHTDSNNASMGTCKQSN